MSERLAIALITMLALAIGGALVAYAAVEQDYYFPMSASPAGPAGLDDGRNAWYSRQLRAFGEPVLRPEPGKAVYRFTWLRTFHRPVCVRVTVVGNQARLEAKELTGAGGYDPGKIGRRVVRSLSAEELRSLERHMRASAFLALPATESGHGLDGSQWIVEASTDRYRFVDRWSPDSGPVRDIGLEMLSLTGWRFAPQETY